MCNKTNHVLVQFIANHFTDNRFIERVGATLNITIIAFTIAAQLQTTKLSDWKCGVQTKVQ